MTSSFKAILTKTSLTFDGIELGLPLTQASDDTGYECSHMFLGVLLVRAGFKATDPDEDDTFASEIVLGTLPLEPDQAKALRILLGKPLYDTICREQPVWTGEESIIDISARDLSYIRKVLAAERYDG